MQPFLNFKQTIFILHRLESIKEEWLILILSFVPTTDSLIDSYIV